MVLPIAVIADLGRMVGDDDRGLVPERAEQIRGRGMVSVVGSKQGPVIMEVVHVTVPVAVPPPLRPLVSEKGDELSGGVVSDHRILYHSPHLVARLEHVVVIPRGPEVQKTFVPHIPKEMVQ